MNRNYAHVIISSHINGLSTAKMRSHLTPSEFAARLNKVADKFDKAFEVDREAFEAGASANALRNLLNFSTPDICENFDTAEDPICGTEACHGGWLAVFFPDYRFEASYEAVKGCLDFLIGAAALADELGLYFEGDVVEEEVEGGDALTPERREARLVALRFPAWAHQNAQLWGGVNGRHMFQSWGYEAFEAENETCTLKTISDWYRAVAGRVAELGDVWPE